MTAKSLFSCRPRWRGLASARFGFCLARLALLATLTSCGSMGGGDTGYFQTLTSGSMPAWTATRFDEAESTAVGVLRRPYREAVLAARHRDREALEEVISCSYGRYCDAAAAELHGGVLEQLMLAWGDIDFSRSLASVKARHGGRFPKNVFLFYERDLRRFFPLTANVLLGAAPLKATPSS